MPIHHTIIYDVDAQQANACQEGAGLETELVQHAIVSHEGSLVEQIDVTYSPDSPAGPFPTGVFRLLMFDLAYSVRPINRSVTTAHDNGSEIDVEPDVANNCHIVTFTAPSQEGEVLFEFGTASTPPTKLKVTIKHKPQTFACP